MSDWERSVDWNKTGFWVCMSLALYGWIMTLWKEFLRSASEPNTVTPLGPEEGK